MNENSIYPVHVKSCFYYPLISAANDKRVIFLGFRCLGFKDLLPISKTEFSRGKSQVFNRQDLDTVQLFRVNSKNKIEAMDKWKSKTTLLI